MGNQGNFGDLMTPQRNMSSKSRVNGVNLNQSTNIMKSPNLPHDFTNPGLGNNIQQTSQFTTGTNSANTTFDQGSYMQLLQRQNQSKLPQQQSQQINSLSRNQTFNTGPLPRSNSRPGTTAPNSNLYINQPSQTYTNTQEAPILLSPVNNNNAAASSTPNGAATANFSTFKPPSQSTNLNQQQMPDLPSFALNQQNQQSQRGNFQQQSQQHAQQQQLSSLLLQQQQQQNQMNQQSFLLQQQQMQNELFRSQSQPPPQAQQQFNGIPNQQQPQNFDQIQLLAQYLQNQQQQPQNQFNQQMDTPALIQQLQLLQGQQQRQTQGMFYPSQQNQPSALNQQISANVDNYKRIVAQYFQNHRGLNQNIPGQMIPNNVGQNNLNGHRSQISQLEPSLQMNNMQQLNQNNASHSTQQLQQNFDGSFVSQSQQQVQQNQNGALQQQHVNAITTSTSFATGKFLSPNETISNQQQHEAIKENEMVVMPGSELNNVDINERKVEQIQKIASNQNSISAIKNDDGKSIIGADRINKIGDAENDNSAILEGNLILGALNEQFGSDNGQNMDGDQNNNSSSFLKNNEFGNADDQADGTGIVWLSGAQVQQNIIKEGSENKTVSTTAEKVTPNVSQDNIKDKKKQESTDSPGIEQENHELDNKNEKTQAESVANTECIEEQPILPKQHLTFEEMLESQLQKTSSQNDGQKSLDGFKHSNNIQISNNKEQHTDQPQSPIRTNKTKREFLRRGSSNKYNPNPTSLKKTTDTAKKYSYYADNFNKNTKKPQEEGPEEPEIKKKEPESPKRKASPAKNAIKSATKLNKNREASMKELPNLAQVNKSKAKDDKNNQSRQSIQSSKQSQASNSNKLKFAVNASSPKVQKKQTQESDKESVNEQVKLPKPKRNGVDEQKRPDSRQNNRQLFKKQTKKVEKAEKQPSPDKKLQNFSSQDIKKSVVLQKNIQPKKMKSYDQQSKSDCTNENKGSSTPEQESSGYSEKNSILEFEMLEKECFVEEKEPDQIGSENISEVTLDKINVTDRVELIKNQTYKSNQQANAENIEIPNDEHQSPHKKSKEEILHNIINSPLKSHRSTDTARIDQLETQLLSLIAEQEKEVIRLQEENKRVTWLQDECQKQLDKLNKESYEQEKSKSQNGTDIAKLKNQLKQKDLEIINLQEQVLTSQDSNHQLKAVNQSLNEQLDELTDRYYTTAETQTDAPERRNVLTNTNSPVKIDASNQTEQQFNTPRHSEKQEEDATPSKSLSNRLELEEHQASMPVQGISPRMSSPRDFQQDNTRDEKSLITEDDLKGQNTTANQSQNWDACELTLATEREGVGNHESPSYKVGLISKAVRVASVAAKTDSNSQQIPQELDQLRIFSQNNQRMEEGSDSDSFSLAEKQAENFAKAYAVPKETIAEPMLTEVEEVKDIFDETEQKTKDDQEDAESLSETSEEYDLVFPEQYHSDEAAKNQKLVEEFVSPEGKIQRIFDSGKKEVIFPNGVKREVWPDGYQLVFFQNNDIKQSFKGGKVVYFFSEAKTTQTTFPDGIQVFKFQNNQIEKHFTDGTKEISFPDGTVKCLYPDGEEESIFPDGTIQKIEKSGVRCIEYPHGQRDFMYPDGTKVREYADGTIKKVNPNGSVETIHTDDQDDTEDGQRGDLNRSKA